MESLKDNFDKVYDFANEYPQLIFSIICLIVVFILVYYYGDVYYGKTNFKEKIADIEDELKSTIKEIYAKQRKNMKDELV